tara:strand:- start:278 stop:619 length:342 start_codon:yes stop_codon:yes gene_type:complete
MNKLSNIYNHFSKLNLIRIIFLFFFFTFSVNYTFNLYDSFTNNFTVNSYDIDSDSNEESEENERENELEDLDECFFNSTLSNHLNSGSLLNTTKFNFPELSLFIEVDSPPPIC